MNLREHVVLGGTAALVLSPVLGARESALFFAASVLVDIDHYWEYLVKNGFRNWSWRKTFAYHHALFPRIRDPEFLAINLFHTVEWFLAVFLAGTWLGSSALLAVFYGMVFHLGLDLARLTWCRAVFARALSAVEYVIRRRRMRRAGLDPDRIFVEALADIGVLSRQTAAGRPRQDVMAAR